MRHLLTHETRSNNGGSTFSAWETGRYAGKVGEILTDQRPSGCFVDTVIESLEWTDKVCIYFNDNTDTSQHDQLAETTYYLAICVPAHNIKSRVLVLTHFGTQFIKVFLNSLFFNYVIKKCFRYIFIWTATDRVLFFLISHKIHIVRRTEERAIRNRLGIQTRLLYSYAAQYQ